VSHAILATSISRIEINMTKKPRGTTLNYCPQCATKVNIEIPAGDHLPRYVCNACDTVLYENPKLVVGCVAEYDDRILLCKRAIEPRLGYWTVPAGFMELGETLEQGAARETLEEACATVTLGSMLAAVDVPEAGQVHIFFRGTFDDGKYGAGDESLESALYLPEDIPWDDIAFRSGQIALKQFLAQKEAGIERLHTEIALRNRRE
jgi:ADP-ribose pyrophosphatase YjhB (NUDIX family)